MTSFASWFDQPMLRFATSGTLITFYLIADRLARRGRPRLSPRPPRWVHPAVFVSLTAFYLLIGPAGGSLAGGFGNLAGILLVLVACAMRFTSQVRYPELAGRGLLYIALPLAVGVPWGWLALSLPACVMSFYVARRADRLLAQAAGAKVAGAQVAPLPAWRMIPGLW